MDDLSDKDKHKKQQHDWINEELTDEEIKKLRRMLESHEFTVKLWATVAVWAKWIGMVSAGVVAVKLMLGELRGLLK